MIIKLHLDIAEIDPSALDREAQEDREGVLKELASWCKFPRANVTHSGIEITWDKTSTAEDYENLMKLIEELESREVYWNSDEYEEQLIMDLEAQRGEDRAEHDRLWEDDR